MFLSLIIPIYNAEKYLYACLNSCINQKGLTLGKDYQVVCVNDGSTDGSSVILEEYKTKGDGIIIIDKSNGGVSDARNVGLHYAEGKYVWFIDADDIIRKDCLHYIIQALETYNATGCIIPKLIVQEEYTPEDIPFKMEFVPTKKLTNCVVDLVIAKEHLVSHDISFNVKQKYCEDTLWSFYVALYKHTYIEATIPCYFYRQVATSAMHNKSYERHKTWIDSMTILLDSYRDVYKRGIQQNMDSMVFHTIETKIHWCIQNIMFGALKFNRTECLAIWKELKDKSLYPYPILWKRFTDSIKQKLSIAQICVSAFCLFFPIPIYYYMVVLLITKNDTKK